MEPQRTSLCHFRFLFRAGRGGRDSQDWQAQMDSRSDLTFTHPPPNTVILNRTFSPRLSLMIMFHQNMCKLDVNSSLPQGNEPKSTFQLIWTKKERLEYICDMLIGCFAVGRDRDNWRGWKAWREGKGFSLLFLLISVWCSLCVCLVGVLKLYRLLW